jgi:transcriptional regulator with XRE-family HTH domain
MARQQLTEAERDRGRALGGALRRARGSRSQAELASAASVPLDTLRKLEQGGTPTPGFFLVAQIAHTLGIGLDDLATATRPSARTR